MSTDRKSARHSQKGLHRLLSLMEEVTNHLILSMSESISEAPQDNERFAALLLQSIGVSIKSIKLLLDQSYMGARDALGISRSICESAVNTCYLLTEGVEVGQKATRYSEQRFFRDSTRSVDVGGLRVSVTPQVTISVDDFPSLKNSLKEFTRPSGAEIRDWCGVSIDERIKRVSKTYPQCGRSLAASRVLVYGVSSEILHGSPYGVLYFWTAYNQGKLRDTARAQLMGHYFTAVGCALFAINGIAEILVGCGRADEAIKSKIPSLGTFERLLKLNFSVVDGGHTAGA